MKIELRNLRYEDYFMLKDAMIEAYAGIGGDYWQEEDIKALLEIFPEGQLCVLLDGKVMASALSIIVNYRTYGDDHTFQEITGNYTFSTHDDEGDVLYGIEMFVHPDSRGLRLGRRLYDARKELCENLNLRAIIAGGRIPNYKNFADKLTPRQYIEQVKLKEIYDPTLTFQMSNGFHVKKILNRYLPGDTESKEFATLLEWNNIYYVEKEQLINVPKPVVRLGLVQWQMRLFDNIDALVEQVEYFVDAVSDLKSDFILFPAMFNAPLLAEFNHLGEAKAIRELAKHTEPLLLKFIEMATAYNINIITGSMPILENGMLLSVSYLCRRDGTWDSLYKVHPFPSEVSAWGMSGAGKVRILDTDSGRIGILIDYDVCFPEIARYYAKEGVQILFVPFLAETHNDYTRIRLCAQARAIENECYVAIAGCVGNLPKVNNMDISYAQSAIFTPSDFAFPSDGVRAQATPNTEMTVVADVDLEMLKELHEFGSAQLLKNRRQDLYEVRFKGKVDRL
jgi:predicted amidohydrolase/GNAT superfamily N-acetyltransferase